MDFSRPSLNYPPSISPSPHLGGDAAHTHLVAGEHTLLPSPPPCLHTWEAMRRARDWQPEKTLEPSPKSQSFASAMASSSVSNAVMLITCTYRGVGV